MSQSVDNYYSALSIFSRNMGHPQPIEIGIIKKCPKLPGIYSNGEIGKVQHITDKTNGIIVVFGSNYYFFE